MLNVCDSGSWNLELNAFLGVIRMDRNGSSELKMSNTYYKGNYYKAGS
jgi:hypothetical protein